MDTISRIWPSHGGGPAYDRAAICALIGSLPTLSPLRDLPPAVHARLAMLARARTFPDDTVILWEGEAADYLYLILHGRVRMELTGVPPDIDTDTLGPGSVLGVPALAGSNRQLATARAVGTVEVLALSHLAVALTALQFPDAAAALRQAFRA